MSGYILDMMAQIKSSINNVPETLEQFVEIFLNPIPKNCRNFALVADTCRDINMKSEDWENWNLSAIIIGSIEGKILRMSEKFYQTMRKISTHSANFSI